MAQEKPGLQTRIEKGQSLLLAEAPAPKNGDGAAARELARRFKGKVHALGISDNRDETRMSALAAAALTALEGVEPILHIVTRDRNRIALISDCLGAQGLGIRNVLCTSGSHQTLGKFRKAKSVYDIDVIQLLKTLGGLDGDGAILGESGFAGAGNLCLGAVAAPYADPLEMQLIRLAKKIQAGARFLVTQPVFDLERFASWWKAVTEKGMEKKTAFVAGVRVLTSAEIATACANRRPSMEIPEALVARITSASGAAAQRQAGMLLAIETIQELSALKGLRGFEISGGDDDKAALEVIEKSGLKAD